MSSRADDAVDELLALLRGPLAAEAYDEDVSQLDHALQCAALAVADGADDALVVAALVHDVGHLLAGHDPDADLRHEAAGARHLRPIFGAAVAAPVAAHVDAKRYLCATDPGYLAGLSAASRHSLELQGGPMDEEEQRRFLARQRAGDAIRLRRWDDLAKVPDAAVPALEHYEPVLRRVAERT